MADRRTNNAIIWLVIGLMVVVLVMGIVMAFVYSDNDTGFGMMGGMGLGFGAAFMVIGAVVLVVIIVIALGGSDERTVVYGPQPSAQDILDQRYARGELSQEDYARMRSELGRR